MHLPDSAPVVIVPMCVKFLQGQNYQTVGEKYLTAIIEGAGAYPLSFPALGPVLSHDALIDLADGILFTGSPSNIGVEHYGGTPDRPEALQDPGRDAVTLPLIRAALARNIPIFAICRGFQELNVSLGGTLHSRLQDIPGNLDHRGAGGDPDADYAEIYRFAHDVTFTPGSRFAGILGRERITVNSVHWQGIDRLAPGLVAEGHAPDGVIEAVTVRDHTGFCIATQWHPEYQMKDNPDSLKLFAAFGEACRDYAARRRSRAG